MSIVYFDALQSPRCSPPLEADHPDSIQATPSTSSFVDSGCPTLTPPNANIAPPLHNQYLTSVTLGFSRYVRFKVCPMVVVVVGIPNSVLTKPDALLQLQLFTTYLLHLITFIRKLSSIHFKILYIKSTFHFYAVTSIKY